MKTSRAETAEEDAPRKDAAAEPRWTIHLARAADAFCAEMRGVVPDEFSKHARGSVKEALLAVRSLIDAGIERCEAEPRKPKARKIEVE